MIPKWLQVVDNFIAYLENLYHTRNMEPTPTVQAQAQVTQKPVAPSPSKLDIFTQALTNYEGVPGDLNYQLNNPGDCRPSPVGYLPKYQPVVIIDTDTNPQYLYHKGSFAMFPSWAIGWEYLQNLILNWATLHPTWTFLDFFNSYSPSTDGNAPAAYAAAIAKECGVTVETTLSAYFNS